MGDTMDPAKMKVVELRAELSARGLDTKGVKAALVKRLKDALEAETGSNIPETSILETSSEDVNTSQDDLQASEKVVSPKKDKGQEVAETVSQEDAADESQEQGDVLDDGDDQVEGGENEDIPPDVEKSLLEEQDDDEAMEDDSQNAEEKQTKATDADRNGDQEKDKREEDSRRGERRQGDKRQRSRSPRPKSPERIIKEDEPELNPDAVQLSWYDSDLNLQIDKETFLSARPMHADGFGFLWSGVRSSHGVSSGKVWYEVKITEECQWEPPKQPERQKQNSRSDRHRQRERSRDKGRTEKPKEVTKSDDVKVKNEEEKMEVEESADVETQDKPADENKGEENGSEEADVEVKKEEDGDEQEEEVKPEDDESKVEDADDKPADEENKNKDEENKEEAKENEKPEEPEVTHLLRVGWSTADTTLQLGEQKYSYGYDSTGLSVTDSVFAEYGKKFANGDVIASFLDLESDPITITYAINGEVLPTAFTIPQSELPEDFALFPHILTRNYGFEVNLGQKEEPWFSPPEDFGDYSYVKDAESKIAGPARPEKREDCEIIMMCGLPSSGKTHWVYEWVKNNPEKRYTLFGITHVLNRMKVQGKTPRKDTYKGHWNSLHDMCSRCLNKLLELASQRRRNYILDQTNVFPSAQRRKLRPFQGFQRRAVVVVVSDEEQKAREARKHQADGKDVPDSATLEMKASMTLPTTCEWLEEVTYAELDESEAKKLVEKYNKEGRDAGYGPSYSNKRSRMDDRRWNRNGRDRRDNRDRRGSRGGPRGWGNQRGNWNRDRNYRPPPGSWRGPPRPGPGYNRNQGPPPKNGRNPPYRNQGWGGGGGWNQQGGWGGGWGGNQGDFCGDYDDRYDRIEQNRRKGGWSQGGGGNWGGQYGQGGWKGSNYGSGGGQYQQQNYQQGQGYGSGSGGSSSQYPNWNYWNQYAQGWNQAPTGGSQGYQQQGSWPYSQQQQGYAHSGSGQTGSFGRK